MSSRLLPPDDPRPVAPVLWPAARAAQSDRETEAPEEAPARAEVDVAAMEREWGARVSAARAQGAREGEAAGRERAAAELEPLKEKIAQTLEELTRLRPMLRREAEADTVKLALAIARRVIRREISVDPEALRGLVLGALERLQSQEVTRVRVHPSRVGDISEALRSRAGCQGVEVVADGSGDPGAVVFETVRGDLDASVESQLGEIERGLADALRRSGR
jgi:flagellar assembly protein FliH